MCVRKVKSFMYKYAMFILFVASVFIQVMPVKAQSNIQHGPPRWPFVYATGGAAGWLADSSWDYQGTHYAVDIQGVTGDPVYATCSGDVIFWGNWKGWINTIWLKCTDGSGAYYGFTHLNTDEDHKVAGQRALIGEQIAEIGPVGSSGSNDHLHFMKMLENPLKTDITTLPWVYPMTDININLNPDDLYANASGGQSSAPRFKDQWILGYSAGGREIPVYQWGNGPVEKVVVCAIHGGYESNTYDLCLEIIDAVNEDPEFVPRNVTLYVIPVLNPDGLAKGSSIAGRTNDNDVDLNRNWPVGHQPWVDFNSQPMFAGDSPLDQPETALLEEFIDDRDPSGVIFYHSQWSMVFGNEAPGAIEMGKAISRATGYSFTLGGPVVNGAAIDHLATLGVPGFDIELTNKVDTDFDRNWKGLEVFLNWEKQFEDEEERQQPTPVPCDGSGFVEYPIGVGYQTSLYTYNMKLVLADIGKGTTEWVIPAKAQNVSYNNSASSFEATAGYHVVYGTVGAGACDIATMFYHVVNDSKLLHVTVDRLDHSKIIGVPLPAVTIWNPGQDLFVDNKTDQDVVIHWDLKSNPGYVRFWVDNTRGSRLPDACNNATPAVSPKVEIYEPRPARGDPVRDSTQPIAPMFMKAPSIWWWRNDIYRWAKEGNLNPNILSTLMTIESGGYPMVGSSAGALGLFQVVPRFHINYDQGETDADLYDPDFNAMKGMKFYNECLSLAKGDPILAAACYNGGQGMITRNPALWPAETKRYVELFSWIDDAFAASDSNPIFDEHVAGCNQPGWLCARAIEWQQAHPRADNEPGGYAPETYEGYAVIPGAVQASNMSVEYDGNRITIDVPPFVIFAFFYAIAALLAWLFGGYIGYFNKKSGEPEWKKTGFGYTLFKLTTILILIFYFPLNFGRIFTAMETGIMPYKNTSFVLRRSIEEKTRLLDSSTDFLDTVESYLPESWSDDLDRYVGPVQKAKEIRDTWVDFLAWMGNDPVLTPLFGYISDQLQAYVVPLELQSPDGEGWSVSVREFDPIFEPGQVVTLRMVENSRGVSNPWGLHGEQCYSCNNLKSWMGTDVILPEEVYIYSPVTGVIENIVTDGEENLPGVSVWISSQGARFGLVNVNAEDALQLSVGQEIFAGDKIARPGGPHLHVVLEVRNEGGSWADYPLTSLLATTGTHYQWYLSQPPYYDKYVPSGLEVAERSDYIIEEVRR